MVGVSRVWVFCCLFLSCSAAFSSLSQPYRSDNTFSNLVEPCRTLSNLGVSNRALRMRNFETLVPHDSLTSLAPTDWIANTNFANSQLRRQKPAHNPSSPLASPFSPFNWLSPFPSNHTRAHTRALACTHTHAVLCSRAQPCPACGTHAGLPPPSHAQAAAAPHLHRTRTHTHPRPERRSCPGRPTSLNKNSFRFSVLAGNPETHVRPQEGPNFSPCPARKEFPPA